MFDFNKVINIVCTVLSILKILKRKEDPCDDKVKVDQQ